MKLNVLPLRWNMTSSMKDGNCKMAAVLFKNTIVSAGGSPTKLFSNHDRFQWSSNSNSKKVTILVRVKSRPPREEGLSLRWMTSCS